MDVVYGSASRHHLSTGDVDVIFAVCVKKTDLALSAATAAATAAAPSLGWVASPGGKRPPPKKVWGANTKARVGGDSNHINYGQFIEALNMCAVRMYTAIIEKETGTVIDCLPASQKEAATRSAFEVMLLKNIIPTAEQQGMSKLTWSRDLKSVFFPHQMLWVSHRYYALGATQSRPIDCASQQQRGDNRHCP